jgi:hypothetical protein
MSATDADGITARELLRKVRRHAEWRGRRAVARVDEAAMAATWFLRARPNCFIIGAQKCGSTSLHEYLLQHPQIDGAKCKEVWYFDRNYARGEDWYRGHFPLAPEYRGARGRSVQAIVDSTTNYLYDPRVPVRAHDYAPNAKLIVVLRDPVLRAYSHYRMLRALGWEYLSFQDALEQEDGRDAQEHQQIVRDWTYPARYLGFHGYVSRGLYLEQIERWLKVFDRDQLLVLLTDDLRTRPGETVATAHRFLGLERYDSGSYPMHNAGSYSSLDADMLEILARRFEEPNRRLAEFLGRDLGWIAPTSGTDMRLR